MSGKGRKKAHLPTLKRITAYWLEEAGGASRIESELFGYDHAADVQWWARGGLSPVCFGCLMTTGEGGPTSLWMHRGHLVAEVCGGTADLSNLVPICARCNGDMPRFADRASAVDWLAGRQTWSEYLAQIDAVTPRDVDNTEVIADACWGRSWSPLRFVREFPMTDSEREIAACLYVAHEAARSGDLEPYQSAVIRDSAELVLGGTA